MAQFDLGRIYEAGQGGVAMDYVEAHKWWDIAASNGEERARRSRGLVERLMTPEQIAEAKRRAQEWMEAHTKKCSARMIAKIRSSAMLSAHASGAANALRQRRRLSKFAPAYGARNYSQILWITLWTSAVKNFACLGRIQEYEGRLQIEQSAKQMPGLIQ